MDVPPKTCGIGGALPALASPWLNDKHEPATVIVLAGGRSSRMGVDKTLLPFLGKPLIQHVCEQVAPHFNEMLIVANQARQLAFLNIPVIGDEVPGEGPLRGIVSGLSASRHDLNFVMACDIPWVNGPLLRDLLLEANDCDCVVPVSADGYYEPLFAVYRKGALSGMRRALDNGERRVAAVFRDLRLRTVLVPKQGGLDNINTLDDYQRLLRSEETRD